MSEAVTIRIMGNATSAVAALKKTNTQFKILGSSARTANTGVRKLGGGMSGMLRPLAGVALGFIGITAAIRGMTAGIRTIAGFEAAMSKVAAISGAQGEQFKMMSEEARRLGSTTKFSAGQAAEGLSFLAMAGFSAKDATDALEGSLNLAAAGGLDLGNAADIASNVMSAFQIPATEMNRVSDTMATLAANANTNVEQLGEGFKYAAPMASALGVSMEQAGAAMGVMSNLGLQASMAGTGIRQIMMRLADPTSKANKVFQGLGVTLPQIGDEGVEFTDVLRAMSESGMEAKDAFSAFGARGANAALALANNMHVYDDLIAKLDESKGAAAEMARIMNDNLAGDALIAKSAMSELALAIGDLGTGDGMRSLVQGFTDATVQLNKLVTLIGEAMKVGELGELLKNGIILGSQKAANAFVNLMGQAISVVKGYVGGVMALFSDPSYLGALKALFLSFGSLLAGAAAKLGVGIMAALETPMIAIKATMKSAINVLMNGFSKAVDFFESKMLSIMIKFESLNPFSDEDDIQPLLDKQKALNDKKKREETEPAFETNIGKNMQNIRDQGEQSFFGSTATEKLAAADALINQGMSTIGEAAGNMGALVGKTVGEGLKNSLDNFEKIEVFDTSKAEDALEVTRAMIRVGMQGIEAQEKAEEDKIESLKVKINNIKLLTDEQLENMEKGSFGGAGGAGGAGSQRGLFGQGLDGLLGMAFKSNTFKGVGGGRSGLDGGDRETRFAPAKSFAQREAEMLKPKTKEPEPVAGGIGARAKMEAMQAAKMVDSSSVSRAAFKGVGGGTDVNLGGSGLDGVNSIVGEGGISNGLGIEAILQSQLKVLIEIKNNLMPQSTRRIGGDMETV
jgi:TP901 family phage tail tape measure protein